MFIHFSDLSVRSVTSQCDNFNILIPYMGNIHRGNFHSFHSFSLNHECFPANNGLFDQQYKSTEMLQWKFYHEQLFSTQNTKVFPLRMFPVYSTCFILPLPLKVMPKKFIYASSIISSNYIINIFPVLSI